MLPGSLSLEQRLDSAGETTATQQNTAIQDDIADLRSSVNSLVRTVEGLDSHAIGMVGDYGIAQPVQLDEQKLANIAFENHENDEARFAQQDYASDWSERVKVALERQLFSDHVGDLPDGSGDVIPEYLLDGLECRASLCRLEIAASAEMDEIEEQLILRSDGLFTGFTMHYTNAGDAVIFLSND